VIPAHAGGPSDFVRVRFRWPDEHQATLGRTLPLVLRAGQVQLVVAPGETAELPSGPVLAAAVVPGRTPLTAELARAGDDLLKVPFPASDVVHAAFGNPATEAGRSVVTRGSLAFDVTRWADATAPIPEDNQLRISCGGDQLRISREGDPLRIGGRQETSAPLRLLLAGSNTPTRRIAVPRVALDESAVVHVAFDRPWGARPALTPSDDASRLLLAYLNAGENRLAAAMAHALARVRADQAPIRWASPSFAQLLVGYAYALGEDAEALDGWCRRTQAARYLGTDGLILAAQSAWLLGRTQEATESLVRAETAQPVMTLGLGLAVRLAFHLAAEPRSARVDFSRIEHDGERLARLVTSYSRLSSATDPAADTVTTPVSERRPVSLDGRGWRQRAAWAIAYVLVRLQLTHTIRQSKGITTVLVSLQRRAKRVLDNQGGTVRRAWEYSVLLVAGFVTLAWLGLLVAVVVAAPSHSVTWDRLLLPLQGVQAVVFALVGAGVILLAVDRRTRELEQRAEDSENRARKAEDQAMKGRALAAALQAEALSPTGSKAGHALLSEALFGDMIGRAQAAGNVSGPEPDGPLVPQ
jgi:hypothetical protein